MSGFAIRPWNARGFAPNGKQVGSYGSLAGRHTSLPIPFRGLSVPLPPQETAFLKWSYLENRGPLRP